MADGTLKILQVNTLDRSGGAAAIAWNLCKWYSRAGHKSWLAVGTKQSDHPDVFQVEHDAHRNFLVNFWSSLRDSCQNTIIRSMSSKAGWGSQPLRLYNQFRGIEDYDYPGTNRLLDITPERPDILHGHNLHGGYFDMRLLPELSRAVPFFLTLHDAWMISGHCAHSFTCERWQHGCGSCPDLSIPPHVERDSTAFNWQRKKKIYEKSQLYVATPCSWLMKKVHHSILEKAIIESKIIPNGVDLTTYHPYSQTKARKELHLPQDSIIILFTAHGIRNSIWKDFDTMKNALNLVTKKFPGKKIMFIGLGDTAPPEHNGNSVVVFISYQRNQKTVARYYQAADIYIHASRADTFPNTILEALACGKPVVASAVGGIPEQIEDGKTGFLVPEGNALAMAERIEHLISDQNMCEKFGKNASLLANEKFSLEYQANEYLKWYKKILDS